MKLFGGSGGHNSRKPSRKEQSKAVPAAPQQVRAASEAPRTAPKPAGKKGGKVKKQLTKQQKRRRIIITVAVVIALIAGLAAAGAMFIRPPQVNDPTINDKENGDKMNVNSLLNSGTRIDDVFTFVIGAVDEDQTRTDALMVATMDINAKTINIMNIPRDTMCNNGESGAWRKINAAYGMSRGIEQTKDEIERLMGFRPDYYVIVNFDGIAAVVDAIGGVDYEIPFRMEYDDPSQNLHIDLKAGMQHLTGEQVVHFLRWRHNNDYSMQYPNGDEGRVATQQEFLKELASQVLTLSNITNIPKIADAVFQNVKTDLTAGNLLWMGMQALQINNDSIQFFTLPGYGAMSYAGSDPYQYSFFFPYYQETLDLVNKYFNPYEEDITTLDMVSGPEGGSSSGWSGGVSSDEENYVWGDTSEDYTEPDTGYEEPSGGWTDPETGTGTDGGTTTDPGTGSGETGGSTTDPGTGGSGTGGTTDPGTGGGTGGSTTTDPGTGGGETGGTTDPGTGGGETGGTTDPGTGSSETGGSETSGGDTSAVVDPEA